MSCTRWSVAVAWLVACGPVMPPLPGRGGPPWVEIKSAHFTLWTDASAERGRELVGEMEARRQVIMTAMNHAPSTEASLVIALGSAGEVAAYVPKQFIARAWSDTNPTSQPGILLDAYNNDRDHIVSHELTHVISHAIVQHQPHWLSEGIATYFEMADLHSQAASIEIGRPRSDRADQLRSSPPSSAVELFGCREQRCMDAVFYATSWAMFSYLLNEHFDQLTHYLQRLNTLPPDHDAEAWRDAFADLPLDRLDRELNEWLVTGKLRLPRIKVTVTEYPTTQRALSDADVLAARSLLRLTAAQDPAAARADSQAALAVDRTNLLARLLEAAFAREISGDDARATAAAHPDDWRAWELVARALRGSSEGDEAFDRMCALATQRLPHCPGDPPRAESSRAVK